VWGYALMKIDASVDKVILKFYQEIVGPYWDFERKYLEEHYATLPFPLDNIQQKDFSITTQWALSHLIGYLNSWSSVQHYIRQHNENPVDQILDDLKACWTGNEMKNVSFPVFLKLGKYNKF
jgi:hypothetical protein